MFKHILVPLDGSKLAEAVLPAAQFLAVKLDATVTLMHLLEKGAAGSIHGQRHLTQPDEAARYLEETGHRLHEKVPRLKQHLHSLPDNDVARALLEHQVELAPDLILMCSHGRAHLKGLIFGRIAQRVVGASCIPVLLIRAGQAPDPAGFACRRLLVPLDGERDHEQGLHTAIGLARVLDAAIHLLLVVPTRDTLSGARAATGMLMPHATGAVLALSQESGRAYLDQHVARLQQDGLAVTAEVKRGAPAAVIARAAEASDMIVLSTHGHAGTEAFWRGSLAARLLARTRTPLLLVPVT